MAQIEEILVIMKAIDNFTAPFRKMRNELGQFVPAGKLAARQQKLINQLMSGSAQKLVDNAAKTNALGERFDSFRGVLGMSFENWKKFNKEGGNFNTLGGKVGNRFRMLTHGLQGFRMEMLSVMFFGMGLQQFFMGLLRPALEAVGVFELFSEFLTDFFGPVAEWLMEKLEPIIDWFLNLDDGTKLAIGKFVLFGAAIGGLLFIAGMFALGIGGLITVFGSLFAVIVALLANPFTLLLAALIAIVVATGGLSAIIGPLGGLFKKVGDVANGAFQALLNKFPQLRTNLEEIGIDTNTVGDAFKSLANKIAKAFGLEDIFMPRLDPSFIKVSDKFAAKAAEAYKEQGLIGQLIAKFKAAWKNIVDSFQAAWEEKFPKVLEWMLNFGKSIGSKIWEGIKSIIPQPWLNTILGAAIGGVLAGPPGAVVGGLTGLISTMAVKMSAQTVAIATSDLHLETPVPFPGSSGEPLFAPTINVTVEMDGSQFDARIKNVTTNTTRSELENISRR